MTKDERNRTANLISLMNRRIPELASELHIETLLEFDVSFLIPEERIRTFCRENKCGNYSAHYMCPPYIGSVTELRDRIKAFDRGILLRYSENVDVRYDRIGVDRTKVDFHRTILYLEDIFIKEGITKRWGMIGGSCGLCDVCKAQIDEPCLYPLEARTSLESIGIDVLSLLDKLGLDNHFHPGKITWTGCILF